MRKSPLRRVFRLIGRNRSQPQSIDVTAREQEEYSALRSTIRERGTARVWIFLVGMLGWAALFVATAALTPTPVATLVPLVVLAGTFESVFALHVGVERIGRYIQVFYEQQTESDSGWEYVAMSFGRPAGAARLDPLFLVPFALAAALNVLPATLVNPTREELIFIGAAHALFLLRLVRARALTARQRAIELARFQQLKSAAPPPSRSTAN
jgi:hypothetical protein